jgi:Holliday junction resolvase RusA-like endonuclease
MSSNGSMFPIEITVYGEAQPGGSKTSKVVYRKGADGRARPVKKNGRVVTTTYDANAKKVGPWKDKVSQVAGESYFGPVLLGPLVVEFIFYRTRNKGDYGTGRNEGIIKDSAPAYPTKRPDALKLARAVEDCLTGVLWADDAQIVDEYIGKRYGTKARVEIKVWPASATTVLDLVSAGEMEPPKPSEQFEQLSFVA